MQKTIIDLQQALEQKANLATKAWWEKYLKHVIPFRGVKMADIRQVVHSSFKSEPVQEMSHEQLKSLALALICQQHSEDKLAGILFIQEILIPNDMLNWRSDLQRFASLFDDGYIFDWNICDWFCIRALGPLFQREGQECAQAIAAWRTAENLWRRRAAAIAFVNFAAKGEANFPGFTETILNVCAHTVKSSERFAQTGVGWILRELSVADKDAVLHFINNNFANFSFEGLRSASKKMTENEKSELLERKKRDSLTRQTT